MPPHLVNIIHNKDGHQVWPHKFHVSQTPPYPAAGSATVEDSQWTLQVTIPNMGISQFAYLN